MLERLSRPVEPHIEQPASRSRDEFSIGEVIAFLLRYWPLIASFAVAALALGVGYILTAQPTYTATAQLLIETAQRDDMLRATPESLIAMDTPQIESQIALLHSERIAEKVANIIRKDHPSGFDLDAGASQKGGSKPAAQEKKVLAWLRSFVSADATKPSQSLQSKEDQQERALVKEVQGNMDVKRIGLSYALDVSFRATDPQTAAFVANAIADTYVQDKLETRAKDARQGAVWLEARIEQLRRLMNEAAFNVQEFKAKRDYRIIDPTLSEQSVDDDESQDGRAPTAKSSGQKSDSPGSAGGPASASAIPKLSIAAGQTSLEELEARANTYRKLYESYLQTYTETIQKQSYPGTNARVITRASPPTRKSSPKKLFILAVSGFLGTMFGLGLALVHVSLDDTAYSSRQISNVLQVPVFGEIVVKRLFSVPALHALKRRWLKGHSAEPDPAFTLLYDRPHSVAARDIRATAIALKHAANSQAFRVIGLLGTSDDLNSSATSSNIALANARAGIRTLLIDMSPNAASEFAPQGGRGLQDVLDGSSEVSSCVISWKKEPCLSLLLARGDAPITSEQLTRLHHAVDDFREHYDLIFMHFPAQDRVSQQSIWSSGGSAIDAAVLVSKAQTTTISALMESSQNVRIAGKPLLGVIVSDLA